MSDLLTTLFISKDTKLIKDVYDRQLEQLLQFYPAADDDSSRFTDFVRPTANSSTASGPFAPVRVTLGNTHTSRALFFCPGEGVRLTPLVVVQASGPP